MHSSDHGLFMAAALNLVIASPFLAYLLQRRGIFGDGAATVTVRQVLAIPLVTVSAAAGAAHLAGLRAELASSPGIAIAFGAAAAFQLVWAARWLRGPTTGVSIAGAAVNLALFGVWLVSRTVGLPFASNAGMPELVGIADTFAAMFELTLVVGLFVQLWPSTRRALDSRMVPAASASLGVMMAVVAVSLLALFAIVSGGAIAPGT
jgi:hypothetical protein